MAPKVKPNDSKMVDPSHALPSNTSKIPHRTSPHPNPSAGLFGLGSKTLACKPPNILFSSSNFRSNTLGRCLTIIIWRRRAIEDACEKVLESDVLLKRDIGEKSAEPEEMALCEDGERGGESGEVVPVECGRRWPVGDGEGEAKAVRSRWRVLVVE